MVRFVVMAAGRATRMGCDKLALPWKDTSVLGYVLDVVLQAWKFVEQGEVTVIARKPLSVYAADDLVNAFRARGGHWVQVPKPQPLSATIHQGLANLEDEIQGVCFIPGDQVGLVPEGLAGLTGSFLQTLPDFVVPSSEGVQGSPVFFHRRYLPELLALTGEQGGRKVLQAHPGLAEYYPVKPSFFNDVDTMDTYNDLRQY